MTNKRIARRISSTTMVPSDFIPKAAKTLGISYVQLSAALGLANEKRLYNYVNTNRCPRWLELAVQGLLVQDKVGSGKKRPKNMKLIALQIPGDGLEAITPILAMMGCRINVLDDGEN